MREDEKASLWILFLTSMFVLFLVAWCERVVNARQNSQDMTIQLLRNEVTRVEEQHKGCHEAIRDWQEWLDIRKAGWGTAWYLRPKEAPNGAQ